MSTVRIHYERFLSRKPKDRACRDRFPEETDPGRGPKRQSRTVGLERATTITLRRGISDISGMYGDRLLNAQTVQAKLVQFDKFRSDLVRSLGLLVSEIVSADDRLSRLNLKLNDLHTKKARLDRLTRAYETNMSDLMGKIKQQDILRVHLGTLNQRKHILKEYSMRKGLELEEENSTNRLDQMWIYFKLKYARLVEEIKSLESRLDKRRDMVSKMYENKCNKHKQLTEKLNRENDILEKQLCLINNLQND